jgi:hypothetical protein
MFARMGGERIAMQTPMFSGLVPRRFGATSTALVGIAIVAVFH